MALLFISSLVPDKPPYNGLGFTRSGNNVCVGIAESIPLEESPIYITCRPVASFPRGPLWIKAEDVEYKNLKIHILPTLNIKIVKGFYWGFVINRKIKNLFKTIPQKDRKILVYNIYNPPISQLYKICKKYSTRLYAILYDLGIPPKHLKLSKITMLGYRKMEKIAKKYIPKLDGRIVINERIVDEYAPGKDFLLIDGGINSTTISLLPILQKREANKKLVVTLAGMLWEQNGTKLILECLLKHPDLDIIMCFAGYGVDVGLIEKAAKEDNRIKYYGMLSQSDLYNLYEISDVLLNLRIEEVNDMHFPSKLLEYIATGKTVISTSIAHAQRDYGNYIISLNEATENELYKAIKRVKNSDPEYLYKKGLEARNFMINERNWGARTSEILSYLNS